VRSGQQVATTRPTPTPLTSCTFVLLTLHPLLYYRSFFVFYVLLQPYWTRWLSVHHVQVLTGRILDTCASLCLSVLQYSQARLDFSWKTSKPGSRLLRIDSNPAPLPKSPSTPSRKRTRAQALADESSAIVGTLQWTRDGTAVPVSPPAWNPTGGDATLYAYISAHNSYVAAMAASRKTFSSESPVGDEGLTLDASPPSKRPRQAACDADEEEGTVGGSVGFGGPAVIGVDSSVGRDASPPGLVKDGAGSDKDGGAAVGADVNAGAGAVGAASATGGDGDGAGVSEDVGAGVAGDLKRFSTPRRSPFARRKKAAPVVSTGQPRILGLRRLLTRRVLQALVKPKSADDGFHSSSTLEAMLREVVMNVHGVSDAAAKDMLSNVYRPAVPSASGRAKTASSARKAKEHAPVALRLWLRKTRNNIHCSLNKVIQRTCAEGASFDGRSKPAAAEFLGGNGFLESVAGRRGTVLATLATILYCGGNLEECTFPGGENGTAVVKVDLTTLAFVLSKVRIAWVQADTRGEYYCEWCACWTHSVSGMCIECMY